MPPVQPRQKNRFISCLSAAALLLYTLLPFFAIYQLPANITTASSPAPFGDKILLCTAEGFRLVSWADLVSGKEKPKPHHEYRCPLCYMAAHGQLSKPDLQTGAITAQLHSFQPVYFYPSSHRPIPAEQRWQQSLTRSPPTPFIA